MPEKISFYDALNLSHCIVIFSSEGIILDANDNFLNKMGYTLSEIINKHHSIFITNDFKISEEYSNFWKRLRDGDFFNATVERIHKQGHIVSLDASYNPVKNECGNVYKVIKIALASKKNSKQKEKKLSTHIDEFSPYFIDISPEGEILDASVDFLKIFSFNMLEIKAKCHSCLVHPTFHNIPDYQNNFFHMINNEGVCRELYRFGLNGNGFWLKAVYKKLEDNTGKIIKIRKYINLPENFNITEREKLLLAYISIQKANY